ncbi:ECF transporter S component [Geobacillus kaustophilus]|uniref:ECF transporter S component n=1 Tax=Geobacillus kaustophilus TaxID=1462 RepID=UPI0027DCE13E|nr:ECF transporter S component [Geobacillus kaustophilus]WMJ21632.1 ECF transporter S component [Geobacillus kaustophilus]
MSRWNVRIFVSIGVLSAVSYLLMMLNFPLPPFPNFLLVDFSDVPALIVALLYGPLAGVLVELLKNVLNYFLSGNTTGIPIGHIANFTAGVTFILPVCYVYQKMSSRKRIIFGLASGIIAMTATMSLLNYYIFLPAYTLFLGAPAMSAPEIKELVVSAILPFNIIKGSIIGIIFGLLFWRLNPWLQRQAAIYRTSYIEKTK